jgi:hypothetical protein
MNQDEGAAFGVPIHIIAQDARPPTGKRAPFGIYSGREVAVMADKQGAIGRPTQRSSDAPTEDQARYRTRNTTAALYRES